MKQILNPDKITVEVQDITGEKHTLTACTLTRLQFAEITSIGKSMNENKDNFTVISDLIVKQLSIIFDREQEFFDNFDMMVLQRVMEYYNTENTRIREIHIENPIETEVSEVN